MSLEERGGSVKYRKGNEKGVRSQCGREKERKREASFTIPWGMKPLQLYSIVDTRVSFRIYMSKCKRATVASRC